MMASALLTWKSPGASMFSVVTLPSTAISAKRWLRTPMPRATRSSSRPIALVSAAEPSATMVMSSVTPADLPQAPMTKASLTDRQTMASTPFALMAAACSTKPGRCLAEQVGVNAPGTAKSTTFLPLNRSSVETSFGPSAVARISFIDGMASPTLIWLMSEYPQWSGCRSRRGPSLLAPRADS